MDGRGSGGGRVLARRGEERMDRGFGFDRSNEIRAARTRRARIGRPIERTDGRHTRADRRGLDRGLLSLLTPRLVHDRELLHLRRVRRRRRLQIADALHAQDPDVVRVDDVTLRAEHREAGALVEREDLARELLPGRGHAGDDVPDAPVRDAHRVVLSRVGECPARSRARGIDGSRSALQTEPPRSLLPLPPPQRVTRIRSYPPAAQLRARTARRARADTHIARANV